MITTPSDSARQAVDHLADGDVDQAFQRLEALAYAVEAETQERTYVALQALEACPEVALAMPRHLPAAAARLKELAAEKAAAHARIRETIGLIRANRR
ncbi:hypothetical protein [Oceanibacterium hippocampi]|uniref:Uncharacterized protein n=1 Tax=Oceanibacterium hippocampi TaxID=745714 RepID=A0A1Y5TYS6_9PROT|nr:hypothetical protein [Oceanibacterium hippocampi]SLN74344.1 hypothetical protein OCH7691_03736 [Oceanibacterium hippocampi]